jgi:hypothetical protein
VYLRADTIEPAFAIVTFEASEGPAADPSIQNDSGPPQGLAGYFAAG